MSATAIAITVMIAAIATTAREKATYLPLARPGTLVVSSVAEDAAALRPAVERELPGVPVIYRYRQRESGHLSVGIEDARFWDPSGMAPDLYVGDRDLLRYLTGNASPPYDENTVVAVTTDDLAAGTATIDYRLPRDDATSSTKTAPMAVARPADPRVVGFFLPVKVVEELGYHLEPDDLIIDPSVHRTSAAERERIDRRLGGTATAYLEQDYQESTDWHTFVAAALLVALGGALAAAALATGPRSRRVRLRVGGSAAALRWSAAARAGLGAACGTALGVLAGCVGGLCLAWPLKVPVGWGPLPRVDFDVPWPLIAASAVGLPVLAAVIAGLVPPGLAARVRLKAGPGRRQAVR